MPGTTAAGHSFSVVATGLQLPPFWIVVRHLGEQFAGAFDLGRFLSATVAAPALVGRQREFVGHQFAALRGASSSSGSAAAGAAAAGS